MGIFAGKKGLILGLANDHSIAWGIASALHAEGADLGFNYLGDALERRVRPLAESVGAKLVAPMNAQSDEEIDAFIAQAKQTYGQIDFLVHSIAYAQRDQLDGEYLKVDRAGFLLAMDVSAYSLTALVKSALAHDLLAPGAAILTLTYHGAQKIIPNYNVMGVAKAALEASVRYLANDLGPRGFRVNAISAGPLRTLSASGIADFRQLHRHFGEVAPLRRNITIEDVGKTAVWLCSDWSSATTGEVIYVDAGYHHLGAMLPD